MAGHLAVPKIHRKQEEIVPRKPNKSSRIDKPIVYPSAAIHPLLYDFDGPEFMAAKYRCEKNGIVWTDKNGNLRIPAKVLRKYYGGSK